MRQKESSSKLFTKKKKKEREMFFGLRPPQGPFIEEYRCLSLTFHDKADKENGDKVILSNSAFLRLASMKVQFPMQFELINENVDPPRRTHVGVLEFTAPEGQMFVPYWIMEKLLLEENQLLKVRNVSLPLAKFIKLRPQSVDFLEISNPKAVLETALRNFSCLTKDDQIRLEYAEKTYVIDIVEILPLSPENAVSIVEADVHVDFEPPIGYVDPAKKKEEKQQSTKTQDFPGSGSTLGSSPLSTAASSVMLKQATEERLKELELKKAKFVSFSGSGQRIDDKPVRQASEPSLSTTTPIFVPGNTNSKWKQKQKAAGAAYPGQGRTLNS